MTALTRISRLLLAGEARAFGRGMALTLAVLGMGVALLALSGWFITAASAAGLIGMGILFNVFIPSSMVRLLALGRTAARYGERVLTHDATLRALSNLRVDLLRGVLRAPYRQLERLRANTFLNRVTADVDALDGLALRLILPGAAGAAVIAVTALAAAILVHIWVGLAILVGHGLVPLMIFAAGQRLAQRPSRGAELGMQALRSRMIDLVAVREELIAFGRIDETRQGLHRAARYQSDAQARVDAVERRMGFWVDVAGWSTVSAVLGIGAALAQEGEITPARAAVGILAALALSEAVAPVRRALTEIGRMRSAARRVTALLGDAAPPADEAPPGPARPRFVAQALLARRGPEAGPLFAPLDFAVAPGETVALTGRSGCGKSTILLMAAGQIAPAGGRIALGGLPLDGHGAGAAPAAVAMVPQRHALVAGTIAENLRLAAQDAPDEALWQALGATCLARTVTARGGLDMRLGFRGAGLSGGEARRLVLARAILRRPALLLLDEPTEGLDAPTARTVLDGIRRALPEAAILMAAHRAEETDFADRVIALT